MLQSLNVASGKGVSVYLPVLVRAKALF